MMTLPSPLEAIFFAALEKSSPAERAAYLDEACAGDSDLRERVERMLTAHAKAGSFLEIPAQEIDPTIDQPIAEKPGTMIGRYKLLEEIGEGGMGVVYMAEQREPVRRKVALKVVKPGMDTREVIGRFEAERQALALMDHQNIAHVLDGGATESGRPYFVMDLVQGIPITEYCDQVDLTPRQRLELFVLVCQAVQHAHQKGIIHRDLKPSNVLVTLHDGVPVPKIIDFGIAKAIHQQLTEKTFFTGHGRMMGTPLYMSPEQAEMSGLDVDTRSDIYSLGVLLYELLTGSLPFDRQRLREAGLDEVRRVIREEEPPRPSHRLSTLDAEAISTITAHRGVDARRLGRLLRGDLDWIVMKALEKDRTRRYESAADFARDVERHLANEPIQARPPTLADRATKWARRHRPVVWSAAAILLVGLLLLALSTVLITRAYNQAMIDRTTAEADLQAALDVLNQMSEKLGEGELIGIPEVEEGRRRVLEELLRLYRRLEKQDPKDAEVRLAIGKALRRLASTDQHVGDVKIGTERAAEAVARFEALVEDMPSETSYRVELAESYRMHAWLLCWYPKQLEGEEACRKSLSVWQGLSADLPEAYREGQAASKLIWGYLLVQQGKHAKAEPILREILPFHETLFAQSPEHWWTLAVNLGLLGRCAEGEGRAYPAEEFYRGALDVGQKYLGWLSDHPRHTRGTSGIFVEFRSKPEALFFITICHEALGGLQKKGGNPVEAEESYREAKAISTQLFNDYPTVSKYQDHLLASCRWLATLAQSAGRTEESLALLHEELKYCEKAVRFCPDRAEYRLELAQRYFDLGESAKGKEHLEKALSVFDEAMGLNPNDSLAYLRRGEFYFSEGERSHEKSEYEKARDDFTAALRLDPKLVQAYFKRAFAHNRLGAHDESIADCTEAIRLDPERSDAYNLRARGYMSKGDPDRALEDRNEGLRRNPNDTWTLGDRGAFWLDRGEVEKGLADYQRAEQLGGLMAHHYKRRGSVHFQLKNYEKALADIAKAVELNPTDTSNLVWIPLQDAAACPDEGFRQGLLKLADKTIELTDRSAGAYGVKARILGAFGREEEALEFIGRAFDRLPDGACTYELIEALGEVTHRKEAIPYLRKLATLQLGVARFWYQAALAQLGPGLFDSYRDTCRGMLQRFQDNETPADGYWIAWTCALAPDAADDYSPIVRMAEQAVKSAPKSASYLNALGAVLYRAGQFEEAAKKLKEAEALFSTPNGSAESSPAYTQFFLAMAQQRLQQPEDAKASFDKAVAETDRVLREREQGIAEAPWNRRLTLKLLRDEAEALLAPDDKAPAEKEKTEAKPKAESGKPK